MKPDVYYGDVAAGYDASRSYKSKWRKEQSAMAAFLTDGPVLDVPFGTGRFVPIYRGKGLAFTGIDISPDMLAHANDKFPGVNANLGSAFDLPYGNGEFASVVCVRFLEWLPLDEIAKELLDRLRAIADTLIVTITHGAEGHPDAYTYDFGKFLRVIDGLLIENRQVTAHVRDMISEIFKLRPATWDDVVAQFRHDYPQTAEYNIQRLADKFAGFFGLPSIPVRVDTVRVRAEYWNGDKIAVVVEALSDHRFVTEASPRHTGGPLTVVERDGIALMIDGRKRANVWMKDIGPHPVLVIRPNG